MPDLSVEQMAIVHHGSPAPLDLVYAATPEGLSFLTPSGIRIEVPIHDLGVYCPPDLTTVRIPWDHPALTTLGGYCEIYQRPALMAWNPHLPGTPMQPGGMDPVWCSPLMWFTNRQTSGGGCGSTGYASRVEAELRLAQDIWGHIQFWESKIAYRDNGDTTFVSRARRHLDKPERVIRCNAKHYTLGPEPHRNERRDMLGHGGARFRFRLLATGEIIESHNVWFQGQIPDEYRELLPDNAEAVRDV